MELLKIDTTESTNSLVIEMAAAHAAPFAVAARCQTAGRGQRGNSWESEPGANVTLSIYCKPDHVEARGQFIISQAVAMGIVRTLCHFMPQSSGDVAIKWPNDIYVGSRKICGVLIENSLSGSSIARTVIGIGLNVNQREFLSDAPNPVSMWQLSDELFDVDAVAARLCDEIEKLLMLLGDDEAEAQLRRSYFSVLWRGCGYHPYIDVATGRRMMARITDIAPTGHITLTDTDGTAHTYAFKEVACVL